MSQENEEIVQASLDAWNAGEMDAFYALHDPNVIWTRFEGWPEAETLVGLEACKRQWEGMRAPFHENAVEPIGGPVSAGDRVVQRFLWRATGEGPEMKMDLTAVFTLRNGKVFIIENFWDHAEALEAVGLSEEGDTARAMSQENVEVVRRGFHAYNEGDLDTLLEMYDPDVEIITLVLGTHRGRDAVRRIHRENAETMPGTRFNPIEVIGVGDHVVAELDVGGAGRVSGIAPTGERIALALTFRNGLVIRQKVFRTRAEALEAVGLSE